MLNSLTVHLTGESISSSVLKQQEFSHLWSDFLLALVDLFYLDMA